MSEIPEYMKKVLEKRNQDNRARKEAQTNKELKKEYNKQENKFERG